MARYLLTTIILFFLAESLSAKPDYGMAGCGVGSLIFKEDSLVNQSLASTTNHCSGQPFSITTGTSNCIPTGRQFVLNRQEEYLRTNLSSLSKEAARGEGELLIGFAETFGCEGESVTPFAETMQNNYISIWGQPGADAILDATRKELKKEPGTAESCKFLF